MTSLSLGLDVSKGTVEACIKDTSGSILYEKTHDDTANGHSSLIKAVQDLAHKSKVNSVSICMESTGGLERNWYRSFNSFSKVSELDIKVHLINPLLIHGFVREKLHYSTTDVSAARDISEYLRLGRPLPKLAREETLLNGSINLYRMINNTVERTAKLKNELQSLLPQVNPYLCQFTRSSIPDWVLELLTKYPTVENLQKVRKKTLEKISGITEDKAKEIIENAKESIAAYRDEMTGLAVSELSSELIILGKKVTMLKDKLKKHVSKNDLVKRLCTIPGVAEWTAIGLIVELGDIRRFAKVEQVIAYSGLDPSYHQSGDGIRVSKISRKGKPSIRKLLYMPAQSASMHSSVIRDFYLRLKGKGKNHTNATTACMSKLLKIVFAVWVSGKEYDPEYEKKKKTKAKNTVQVKKLGRSNYPKSSWDKSAPITRREAKRRDEIIRNSQPKNNEVKASKSN